MAPHILKNCYYQEETMTYQVAVGPLTFKQDLSNVTSMLADQEATYAVLKYCQEVPITIQRFAIRILQIHQRSIHYKKLLKFVLENV